MPDLIVAGAGMAGLCAAAHAREQGAEVLVLEKAARPGGSMLLSSGFVWRHRELDDFRRECPDGDPALQRLVHERLDADLDWLEELGAPVSTRETGNPLTTGRRFDPSALTEALAGRAAKIRTSEPLTELPAGVPVVLATGGFQATATSCASTSPPKRTSCSCAPLPAASGTAFASGSRRARRPAPASTSSTAATCLRHPPQSRRGT